MDKKDIYFAKYMILFKSCNEKFVNCSLLTGIKNCFWKLVPKYFFKNFFNKSSEKATAYCSIFISGTQWSTEVAVQGRKHDFIVNSIFTKIKNTRRSAIEIAVPFQTKIETILVSFAKYGLVNNKSFHLSNMMRCGIWYHL